MEKMVGLSRAIKLEWLNATVEFSASVFEEKELKEKLNEYLSYEITSPTNLRKTREILMNIWYRTSVSMPEIWNEAIKAYQNDKANKLALSWSMILLSYPVFSDVCGLIAKINKVQDTFTTAWLKEKLLAIWGERTTLFHSLDKMLQTLKSLGAIENVKTGVYRVCSYKVSDTATIKVMLLTLLTLEDKAYYELSDLTQVPAFFPFDYEVTLEWLHNTPEFNISNFGGRMVVSGK